MTAIVHDSVQLGAGVIIWNWSQLREGVTIGSFSSIGQSVYVGPGVSIGKNCKIQNGALIYEPAEIHDGVFIGPNVVLTNDRRPRAVNPKTGRGKTGADWEKVGVTVCTGASLGANVVCVAPIVIGEWAMVGAVSVVNTDIKSHAMYAGNPGRQIGWVSRSGSRLIEEETGFLCPDTGEKYELCAEGLKLSLAGEP